MKPEVVFTLDECQAEIVKPLFDEVREASKANRPGMILCQLLMTAGIIQGKAKFINHDIAIATIAAMSDAMKREAA